jgi:AcrR family transcriptional regulator
MAITHATISKTTEISRSTLYRHWPKIDRLRNDAFKRAATLPEAAPKTNGPLRVDLTWLLGMLKDILNEAPWGQIAPQVIAAAATDREARILLNDLMEERIAIVEAIFVAAEMRGELRSDAPVRQLVEIVISVPYFRKFIAGTALDQAWVESHVDFICGLAEKPKS